MKDRKKVLFTFAMYDFTGLEKYMEKQAKEGWMLEKISGIFMIFHRIEPKNLKFTVTYFKKASAYDLSLSKDQENYIDLCEYSGWKFLISSGEMQFFYSEDENATPLETDAITKVNNIQKTMKKILIPSYIALSIVLLLNSMSVFSELLFDPLEVLANNFLMLAGLCSTLALALTIIEFIAYFKWRSKALKMAEEGVFVNSSGKFNFQYIVAIITSVGTIFMLASIGGKMLLYIGIGIGITIWLIVIGGIYCRELFKKCGLSKRANRIVTTTIFAVMVICIWGVVGFVSFKAAISRISKPAYTYKHEGTTFEAYNDEIPFRIEDFMDTGYTDYSTECTKNSSVLVDYIEASQRTRFDAEKMHSLEYDLIKVKVPLMYDLVKKVQLKAVNEYYGILDEGDDWYELAEIDAKPWGANEVYQVYIDEEASGHFLLLFDDVIVEIQFDDEWELTDEQKSVIGEKLKNIK